MNRAGIGSFSVLTITVQLKITKLVEKSQCSIQKGTTRAWETAVSVAMYQVKISYPLFLGHILKIAISVILN